MEYAALIVLAALVIGALVSAGLPGTVADKTEAAVCRIFHQETCANRSTPPPVAKRTGSGEGGPSRAPGKGSPPSSPGLTTGPPTEPPHAQYDTPNPSPNPPPSEPPPSAGEVAREETERLLEETPIGRDALECVREHGTQVVWGTDGGSYQQDSNNAIYLDIDRSPSEIASSYVHEANHACHRNEIDPDDLTRDEYIDRSLSEEVRGTVLAIRFQQQLQELHPDETLPEAPLQDEYEQAYDAAVGRAEDDAFEQGRTLTDAEKRSIGERAGEARVMDAFRDGEVVGSAHGYKYPDHYGKQWDDAHAHDGCFPWVFC